MADVHRIQPNRAFLQDVLAEGGEDLKRCFQCATCSVVCELSNGDSTPFPRKEMLWAQWGLKDRLVADPDVWRCHQCNECSVKCPRGARPGDVLAALRRETVLHYAVPQCLARWLNRLNYLPLLLLIPTVILALALLVRQPLQRMLSLEEPREFYASFFPHWLLIGLFAFFSGLAFLAAVAGVVRFWHALKAADEASGNRGATSSLTTSIMSTLKVIASHRKFGQCATIVSRRSAHLLAFYGFIALYVVTLWAVLDLYVFPFLGLSSLYPFGLLHPFKILANVGCVALIAGCVLAMRDRLGRQQEAGASTAFDWIFLGDLLATGVTGLATEILRFVAEPLGRPVALENTAYAVYFVHLVLVFALLIYLPYGKFAHLLYRTTALVYAEHTGRTSGASQSPIDHR